MKEQLIKSVYASTKDVKETNDQYEQQIKLLEKVRFLTLDDRCQFSLV